MIWLIISFSTNALLLVVTQSFKLTELQIYPQGKPLEKFTEISGLEELDPPITNYPTIPYSYRWELFGWAVLCLFLSVGMILISNSLTK